MPSRGIYLRITAAFILLPALCFAQSETDLYDQATGLMGEHKYTEAEAAFRKSIHVDPRYKEAWEGLASALKAQGKDASAVAKMADAAPAARAGASPPLTLQQRQALGEADPAQAGADSTDSEIAALKAKVAALEARKRAAAPARRRLAPMHLRRRRPSRRSPPPP